MGQQYGQSFAISNNHQFINSTRATASASPDHNLVYAKCNIPRKKNKVKTDDLNNSTSIKELRFFTYQINWGDITTHFGAIAWQGILDSKPPDAMYHAMLDTCLRICIDNVPKRNQRYPVIVKY